MLDIAVIIPQLAKHGGAERFAAECISRWQHDHQITLYAAEYDLDILAEYGVQERVRLVRLTSYFDGPNRFVLNGTLLPKIWEQEIGTHEVYHAHLWPTNHIDRHPLVWFPHEPPRMLRDLRHSIPVDDQTANNLWRMHCYPKFSYDYETDHRYEAVLNTLARFDVLGRPDRIVANSHYTAGQLRSVYGRPVTDIVYPGVTIDAVVQAVSDEPLFLTVAQLWPHKRTRIVIEAVSLVPGVQLYIIGDGPEYDDLSRMVHSLGLSDRVIFMRKVTNQELVALYRRCRAVIFAASNEPFGIVALEALAAAKPLLSAGEGGYTEIIDKTCAFRVAARPVALAEKIVYLRDHPGEAAEMGRAGFQKARGFTWERTAEELLNILSTTASEWHAWRRSQAPAFPARREWPLMGAHLYCWYGHGAGSRHWNDNPQSGGVNDMPQLGYYASSDGLVIEQQLKTMADVGLDFAILNLHVDGGGLNSYELASAKRMMAIAARQASPVRFAVQICIYDDAHDLLIEALDSIAKLSLDPSYLRIDDRPVLFVFWNGMLDRDLPTIELLKRHTTQFVRIASSLRMYFARDEHHKTFRLFHGWSLFSPLELGNLGKLEELWSSAYQNADAGTMDLRIATVSPGYDDRHLVDPRREDNPYRLVDRRGGETYRQTIDFATRLDPPPHLIIVSTYNEYHENTHIETSHNHGSLFMEMTKHLVDRAREMWRTKAGR